MLTDYLGLPHEEEPGAKVHDYRDYARAERRLLASPEGKAHVDLWRKRLESAPPPLQLPADRPRRPGPMRAGGRFTFVWDEAFTARIRGFAAQSGSTYFTVLFAAFKSLLHGLSGASDIPLWFSNANRARRENADLLGWVQTMVLDRTSARPEQSFASLVGEISANLRRDLAGEMVSHSAALATLAADHPEIKQAFDRKGVVSSLWQFEFSVRRPDNVEDFGLGILLNEAGARISFGGIEVETIPLPNEGCDRDLVVYVQEYAGRIYGEFKYNGDIFLRERAEAMLERFRALVERAIASPAESLARIAGQPAPARRAAPAEQASTDAD
jgi:hypothetical protein